MNTVEARALEFERLAHCAQLEQLGLRLDARTRCRRSRARRVCSPMAEGRMYMYMNTVLVLESETAAHESNGSHTGRWSDDAEETCARSVPCADGARALGRDCCCCWATGILLAPTAGSLPYAAVLRSRFSCSPWSSSRICFSCAVQCMKPEYIQYWCWELTDE